MTSSAHAAAYQQPAAAVIAGLGGDAERGLTTEEARRRLEQYGPNELQAEPPVLAWRKFLAQFQSPLIILLLIAAAFSLIVWVYEGDEPLPFEALAIFAIVLLNGIPGFVQEERAERSVAALRVRAADEASVLGDGQLQRVPATDLLLGDIIVIK
jgi:Ca2+-transporting ATPase